MQISRFRRFFFVRIVEKVEKTCLIIFFCFCVFFLVSLDSSINEVLACKIFAKNEISTKKKNVCLLNEEKLLIEKLTLIIGGFYQRQKKKSKTKS